MAQTLYKLSCFLIGGDTIFKVKMDSTDEVSDLKYEIKEKKQALKEIDADHLTLHLVTIDASFGQGALINELKTLFENLSECRPLHDDTEALSNIFGEIPAGKRYIILVRTPEGESVYCNAVAETVLTRPFIPCRSSLTPSNTPYRPTSTSTSSVCFILGP